MIRQVQTLAELKSIRSGLHGSVGFVPTMGALHRGHIELFKKARAENDHVIVSVFVNPTQFDNKKDLEKYPSNLEQDLKLAREARIDYFWTPTYPQLYPDQYSYRITENQLSKKFCGAHRPGHFDGVLTVVMKLLNLSKPQRAYFGEKDFQQLTLIKGMVEAYFLDVEIIPVPTIREENGLALSSRNQRLSDVEKKKAHLIYKAISTASTAEEAHNLLTAEGFQVDYIEDFGKRRLAAAYLGSTRLIDNVELKTK